MADQTVRIDLIARANTQAFGKAATDLRHLGQTTSRVSKEAGAGMGKLGAASSAAGTIILLGVGAALAVSAKAAIDFESQFAGVRKTVDASEETFSRLGRSIRDMALEIPISVAELTKITELGGQLGIPVSGLEEFTETIAKLGVTTNLSTEDAATGLARFSNVMGTLPGKFDNLGSAIVDLGNNYATTEGEILSFGTRLAGIGSTIGLSEADVLGLATAFTALGEPAERGATAVQRVFVEMLEAIDEGGGKLETFAEIAGVTAQEFARIFAEDPVDAFIRFEKGLKRIQDEGGNVTQVLQDLQLGSQRTLSLVLKGASGWQTLSSAVRDSANAFAENTALNEEADKRFGTTASQITLMANSFKDLTIELGQSTTGFVNFSVGALGQMFQILQENMWILESFVAIVSLLAVGRLLSKLGNAFFDTGIKIGKSTPVLRAFHQGLGNIALASQRLGAFLGIAGVAIAGIVAVWAANRAQFKQYQEAVEATADAMENLANGTADAKDVQEAFINQLGEKTGLIDRTLDLDAYRDFIIQELGMTTGQLVDMALKDFDGFESRLQGLIDSYAAQRLAIVSESGVSGNITTRSATTGLSPEDAALVQEISEKEFTLRKILNEVAVAAARVRAEQALRREEFELELKAANDGRALIDTWNRFNQESPFSFDLRGLTVTSEEFGEILEDMEKETSDFVTDFLDNWGSLVDGFNEQMFNWGSAWQGYERVTALSTDKIKTSMQNWLADQRALSAALLFVTENFGADFTDLFLSLPEDVQRQLAAALEISPAMFNEQFGLFITANEEMIALALQNIAAMAPLGGQMLWDSFNDFFQNVLIPGFAGGATEGSEAFLGGLANAMAQIDTELATASPQVSAAFQALIDSALTNLELQGLSTATVEKIVADMTTAEKIQWFHDQVGLSWAESSLLGYFYADLPSAIDAHMKENATPSPALLKEFEHSGIAWAESAREGWGSDNLPPLPESPEYSLLNSKFFGDGGEWAKQAAAGFKNFDLGGELADKVTQAANQANAAAENVWGMASPSKVFQQYGEWVGEGFNLGLGKSLVKPAEQLFASLSPKLSVPQADISSKVLSAIEAGVGRGQGESTFVFQGDVANEDRVVQKIQKATALRQMTRIAETAPGRT